jgi:hypothetical protein
MAVVAVIVLIAVLFFSGTVMALAVSSSLHTADIVVAQDAVHYAAESAVARAAGAADKFPGCRLSGSINNQQFAARCEAQLDNVAPDPVRLLSVPGRWVTNPGSLSFQLILPEKWESVWTVIGWRASAHSASVTAWIDNGQDCDTQPGSPSTSPVYVICNRSDSDDQEQKPKQADTSAVLHIVVGGGSINLGGFLVRAAVEGGASIVTVVGESSFEVDEADVALPNRVVKLWNTVLP